MCKTGWAKACCRSMNLRVMMIIIASLMIWAGVSLIVEGVKVITDSGSQLVLLKNVEASSQLFELVNMTYLLIAVGPVLLIMSFLGCFACVKESRWILLTYFLILLISFLVEVAGATVVLVYRASADQYLNSMEDEVKKTIQDKYGENESLTSLWNKTMDELKCCGFKNYKDFDGSPFDVAHGGDVYPPRCCHLTFAGVCSERKANISDMHGCSDKLLQVVQENTEFTAAVTLALAVFEIFAMVVSMALYCKGRKALQSEEQFTDE